MINENVITNINTIKNHHSAYALLLDQYLKIINEEFHQLPQATAKEIQKISKKETIKLSDILDIIDYLPPNDYQSCLNTLKNEHNEVLQECLSTRNAQSIINKLHAKNFYQLFENTDENALKALIDNDRYSWEKLFLLLPVINNKNIEIKNVIDMSSNLDRFWINLESQYDILRYISANNRSVTDFKIINPLQYFDIKFLYQASPSVSFKYIKLNKKDFFSIKNIQSLSYDEFESFVSNYLFNEKVPYHIKDAIYETWFGATPQSTNENSNLNEILFKMAVVGIIHFHKNYYQKEYNKTASQFKEMNTLIKNIEKNGTEQQQALLPYLKLSYNLFKYAKPDDYYKSIDNKLFDLSVITFILSIVLAATLSLTLYMPALITIMTIPVLLMITGKLYINAKKCSDKQIFRDLTDQQKTVKGLEPLSEDQKMTSKKLAELRKHTALFETPKEDSQENNKTTHNKNPNNKSS